MKVIGKDDIPYIMENKTCSKPPARIYSIQHVEHRGSNKNSSSWQVASTKIASPTKGDAGCKTWHFIWHPTSAQNGSATSAGDPGRSFRCFAPWPWRSWSSGGVNLVQIPPFKASPRAKPGIRRTCKSQSKESKHASTPQFQLMIHPFFHVELMELGAHVSVLTNGTCKLRFPLTHMLHVWLIYHIWVIFGANVGKYSIHGAYGWVLDYQTISFRWVSSCW